MNSAVTRLLTLLCCLMLVACSSSGEKRGRIDYKKEHLTPKSLDIPPDLTQPELSGGLLIPNAHMGGAGGSLLVKTGSEGVSRSAVLPKRNGARIGRDGSLRWLEVEMSAEPLWLKLRKFWEELGLEIERDEPELGLMETGWEENRADIPESGIRALIAGFYEGIYSAPTRDKYRVRLEPLEGDSTAIYLTHYGVEQIYIDDSFATGQALWQRRPSDSELSHEILNRLLRYLGAPEGTSIDLAADGSEQPQRATLVTNTADEAVAVQLNESYQRAWRHLGIVLDRLGVVVEDRNRSAGTYYILLAELKEEFLEDQGWLASLFSDEQSEAEQRYRIVLQGEGEGALIKLLGVDGGTVTSEVREVVLGKLQEGLQ